MDAQQPAPSKMKPLAAESKADLSTVAIIKIAFAARLSVAKINVMDFSGAQ